MAVAAIEGPAPPNIETTTPSKRSRKAPVGLIFVSPALLFMAAFMLYPVGNLLWLSFRDYSPLRSAATPWVGMTNYTNALTNPETYSSIWTTILFTVGAVVSQISVGLVSAVCLAALTLHFGNRPAAVLNKFFAGLFILPFAAPPWWRRSCGRCFSIADWPWRRNDRRSSLGFRTMHCFP